MRKIPPDREIRMSAAPWVRRRHPGTRTAAPHNGDRHREANPRSRSLASARLPLLEAQRSARGGCV